MEKIYLDPELLEILSTTYPLIESKSPESVDQLCQVLRPYVAKNVTLRAVILESSISVNWSLTQELVDRLCRCFCLDLKIRYLKNLLEELQ